MGKKKRKAAGRQIPTIITPTQTNFPIIPTEVFWELNPALHTFLEDKPPQYFPSYFNYTQYGQFATGIPKTKTPGCAPRRGQCFPRPCMPV